MAARDLMNRSEIGTMWIGRDESSVDPARVARTTAALMKGLTTMSWSFDGTGTPADVCKAIDEAVEGYADGQSKDEYAAAAPHLKGLINQAGPEQTVTVSANGHATFVDGQKTYGSVGVKIATTSGT